MLYSMIKVTITYYTGGELWLGSITWQKPVLI